MLRVIRNVMGAMWHSTEGYIEAKGILVRSQYTAVIQQFG